MECILLVLRWNKRKFANWFAKPLKLDGTQNSSVVFKKLILKYTNPLSTLSEIWQAYSFFRGSHVPKCHVHQCKIRKYSHFCFTTLWFHKWINQLRSRTQIKFDLLQSNQRGWVPIPLWKPLNHLEKREPSWLLISRGEEKGHFPCLFNCC